MYRELRQPSLSLSFFLQSQRASNPNNVVRLSDQNDADQTIRFAKVSRLNSPQRKRQSEGSEGGEGKRRSSQIRVYLK